MKITNQQLKQIIKEEIQAELNEKKPKEDWFQRLIGWLTGTTAGNAVLDKANKVRGREQAGRAYKPIPK